jgi:dipeptidyl aminopeptidase/acylaminoacyl peptidase
MKIFDSQRGELVLELGSNWGIPYEAHWSPDGTMIATSSDWEGNYLNIWSVEGERLDTFWAGSSAAWSPDSTRIASTGQIRDIRTGLPVTIIKGMDNEIAWHPNGNWIASTGDAGQIFLWDTGTGEQVTMWQYEDCLIYGFAWSRDGERFAVSCIRYELDYRNELIIRERVQ